MILGNGIFLFSGLKLVLIFNYLDICYVFQICFVFVWCFVVWVDVVYCFWDSYFLGYWFGFVFFQFLD